MASREQLYRDYISELKIYNPNLIFMDNDQIFKNYAEVSSFSDLEWIDIYHGVECVGFVLLTNGSHCPPGYDWFVMECFVEEKYRKQHLMTQALDKIIEAHHGSFGLFILSRNVVAASFWKNYLDRERTKENTKIEQIPVTENSIPSGIDCYELAFLVSECK